LSETGGYIFLSFLSSIVGTFVVQIIVVNFNSLVQINFPENPYFSKFKSSHSITGG